MSQEQDIEHVKLLSIFHYVLAGITALGACIPIIHLVVGLACLAAPPGSLSGGPPPRLFGIVFATVGGSMVLFGWTVAALLFFAGRFLAARTHYRFCFVVAALSCLMFPLGTVLGVFTIIVLSRLSVKALFAAG